MARLPNEDLHGSDLTSGTILVLSFTAIIMGVCLFIGVKMSAPILFVVGPLVLAIGVLLCLPNLKNFVKGKIKEHRIKTGKDQPEQKKTWNPNHRFDD